MTDVVVVRAQPQDAGRLSVLAMASKASNGYDAAFMEQCRDELTYSVEDLAAWEVWLAVDGDAESTLLGSYGIEVADGIAEVHNMFVAPAVKRQGVGHLLWQHLERRAGQLGAQRLELDADPFAVPFYEAMGMRAIGEAPSGSIPGRMLPRMAKLLDLPMPA